MITTKTFTDKTKQIDQITGDMNTMLVNDKLVNECIHDHHKPRKQKHRN